MRFQQLRLLLVLVISASPACKDEPTGESAAPCVQQTADLCEASQRCVWVCSQADGCVCVDQEPKGCPNCPKTCLGPPDAMIEGVFTPAKLVCEERWQEALRVRDEAAQKPD